MADPITVPNGLDDLDRHWFAVHAQLAGTWVHVDLWDEQEWPVVPIHADPALLQVVYR